MRTPILVLCTAAAAAAALTASPCSNVTHDVWPDPATGFGVLVVGQSAPLSGHHAHTGLHARAGIEAAFAAANETSPLRFVLTVLDDEFQSDKQRDNTRRMLCSGANGYGPVFAMIGSVGTTASEASLDVVLSSEGGDGVPVPFIGGLTSSALLRTRDRLIQKRSSAAQGAPRVGVAHARASGDDELAAIVEFLSKDWNDLSSTSVFYQDTVYGRYVRDTVNESLVSLGTTLISSAACPPSSASPSERSVDHAMEEAATRLLSGPNGNPRVIILAALTDCSGPLIEVLARRGLAGVRYVGIASISAEELFEGTSKDTWARLNGELSSSVYFSQLVPMPTHPTLRISKEYRRAIDKYHSEVRHRCHVSFEGFILGRLITVVASRALELHGWPLTRASFLDTLFREVRTFDLHGWQLGPYGDGVGSDDTPQTVDDWCNQGAHEVFITRMSLVTGKLEEERSSSLRFQGCNVSGWKNMANRAVIGFATNPSNARAEQESIRNVHLGLEAATRLHNSDHDKMLGLTTVVSDIDTAFANLKSRQNWVSTVDSTQATFEGFVVGKFISSVLTSMDDDAKTALTSETLLKAIYEKKYFHIDKQITVGPFYDHTSDQRLCNQGMDNVYFTKWTGSSFMHVPFKTTSDETRCGMEFEGVRVATNNDTRTLVLAITIPGVVVVCSLVVAAVVVTSRSRSSLKKLRRSELEIGELIGKGHFGCVHNGDWHGTPVAIRVVDKATTPSEDIETLRGEMNLIHNLHHPNLLMLLGYSESKNDILIVYEFMEYGSLHEYMIKNKQNMNFYNQVAIAFDVIKGLAFLHSAKPPIYSAMIESGKSSSSSVNTVVQGVELETLLPRQQGDCPDIPPTIPKEIVLLLNQCWQKQPERRPSCVGVFEIPSDLSISSSPSIGHILSDLAGDPKEQSDEMMMAVMT
eukprot:m51a1_g6755 putative flag-tagged protein kinase domain of mitogen-activated protein kinase kinase kinase (924) ;mRNA; f:51432-55494